MRHSSVCLAPVPEIPNPDSSDVELPAVQLFLLLSYVDSTTART